MWNNSLNINLNIKYFYTCILFKIFMSFTFMSTKQTQVNLFTNISELQNKKKKLSRLAQWTWALLSSSDVFSYHYYKGD